MYSRLEHPLQMSLARHKKQRAECTAATYDLIEHQVAKLKTKVNDHANPRLLNYESIEQALSASGNTLSTQIRDLKTSREQNNLAVFEQIEHVHSLLL